jgi:hypothetical protein
MATAWLYLPISETTGGFTKVKNPTASSDFQQPTPMKEKIIAQMLQIINPIIIYFSASLSHI